MVKESLVKDRVCDIVMQFARGETSIDTKDNIKDIKNEKNSRFIPIKLTPNEAKKMLFCQRTMLEFARMQYQKSIGTDKEEIMLSMYNDSIRDYEAFIDCYKYELGMK